MGGATSPTAERLAGHPAAAAPAATSTTPTMGIVGPGVGRAVGKGLTAAALATVGRWSLLCLTRGFRFVHLFSAKTTVAMDRSVLSPREQADALLRFLV